MSLSERDRIKEGGGLLIRVKSVMKVLCEKRRVRFFYLALNCPTCLDPLAEMTHAI